MLTYLLVHERRRLKNAQALHVPPEVALLIVSQNEGAPLCMDETKAIRLDTMREPPS